MAQFYWFLGHEQFQPEVLVQHAKLAEAAGFDGVMVSEHFHPWVDDAGAGGFAFSTLGAIAAVTTKLKLMTAVTTPLFRYHPAVVAQAAATLSRLSNGRFELGVGTGENINEGPLGYHFPAYAERSERMTEALHIMHALLNGERVDFNGQHYTTSAAKLYSPPTSAVPIYLAAGGPKTAHLAGRLADGLIVSVKDPAEAISKVITPATEEADGRPFTIVANRWTVFADSDDTAWQALEPWRGLRAPSRLSANDPAQLRREADDKPREEILAQYSQARDLDDYFKAYAPLVTDIGAGIVGLQSTSLDQAKLITDVGREVLPKLRQLKSA